MKIIAIGGGDKTPAITHALELTGEANPHVLLIPSASSTSNAYNRKTNLLTDYFHELGAQTSLLHEYGEKPSEDRIAHEIGRSALIYTIGGNSPHMLKAMRQHGTDVALSEAIRNGKIHAGTSAGALLPFELAHSNVSAQPSQEEWDFDYLPALGLIDAVATAHADKHDETPHGPRPDSRYEALVRTFPQSVSQGYAIDNDAALVIRDDMPPQVIRAKPTAHVQYIQRNHDGAVSSRPI